VLEAIAKVVIDFGLGVVRKLGFGVLTVPGTKHRMTVNNRRNSQF
jgi:CRISPR/Cas system endoribonuclease Cas6 (RAMP superfamily)